MSATEELGIVYRQDDWPHGLSCMDCPHVFDEGDRYTERLYAFVEDVPMVEIVCLRCATAARPERSDLPA